MPLVLSSAVPFEDDDTIASIDRSGLSDDLSSGDLARRKEAVLAAARLGEMSLLAGHVEDELDAGLRARIMTILARAADPRTVAALVALLRSEDAGLRNEAIETLQVMGEAAVPEIEALLDDPDSDVRIFAMNVALQLQSPRVPDMALAVLLRDENANVCAAALDILAEVARADMAPAIASAVDRFPDAPFLAFAIRATLKRIG